MASPSKDILKDNYMVGNLKECINFSLGCKQKS